MVIMEREGDLSMRFKKLILAHYPKENSFLGHVKDDSLAVGGR